MKLYLVEAHFSFKTSNYYVVAEDSVKAEEKVKNLHEKQKWFDIEYCHVKVLAEDKPYGKPNVLIT